MSTKQDAELGRLAEALDDIGTRAERIETTHHSRLALLHARQLLSGLNLLHYLALRSEDIRGIQNDLAKAGLSSLGNAEAHVLASLGAIQGTVGLLRGQSPRRARPAVTFDEGRGRIRRHSNKLFGKKLKGSPIRIMVTLPDDAANDYALVRDMVRAGMNCARINCAQGTPDEWERMVTNVHRAREVTGRGCKIFMDLSGPKIRIGTIAPEPSVLKISPERDVRGTVVRPAVVEIIPEEEAAADPEDGAGARVPVRGPIKGRLRAGDRLEFVDTRGKKASFTIEAVDGRAARALCDTTVYLENSLPLLLVGSTGEKSDGWTVQRLAEPPGEIVLRTGDVLVIHKDPRPGEPARPGIGSRPPVPAHVSCALPEVFEFVEVGQPLLLDDGRIGGLIRAVGPERMVAEITHAELDGSTLRAHKGINLPETALGITGLTDKDREDLCFVAKHADAVNASFINRPSDVEDLQEALRATNGHDLGVVLKIETRLGVNNLPEILLEALKWPVVGVMIARGDLAVEVGWAHLARVQEEVLRVSEAAHVPVIWATEVLDRLAKKGLPTRAEISDVVMAGRAECVMLNKGPYITDAIRTLETLLSANQVHQNKKAMLLPALSTSLPAAIPEPATEPDLDPG